MTFRLGMLLLGLALCLGGGAIAAEEPQQAEPSAPVADVEHGRSIFSTICSHCHKTSHEYSAVGAPGLLDVLDRHDEAWIDQWIQGPEAFARRDEDAKALVESNPYGLIMPTLPEMQNEQNRRDIIAFLKTLKSK